MSKSPPPRVIELPDASYQPGKSEMNEPIRIKGALEDALHALTKPVAIRRVSAKKWRERK